MGYPGIMAEFVGKIGRTISSQCSAGILPAELVKRKKLCGLEVRATSIFPTNSGAPHQIAL